MPQTRRFWVFPIILIVAGAVNMLLTIGSGFPFGLLFLLALLGIVAFRGSYTAGWIEAPPTPEGDRQDLLSAPVATAPILPAYTPPPTRALPVAPEPVLAASPKPVEPAATATHDEAAKPHET